MLWVSHWIFATLLRTAPESSSTNMVTENGAWEAVSAWDSGPALTQWLSARGGLNPSLTQHQTSAQLWGRVGLPEPPHCSSGKDDSGFGKAERMNLVGNCFFALDIMQINENNFSASANS